MDFATIGGMFAGFALIITAMILGGGVGQFGDTQSALIVVGGAIATTLMRFSLKGVGSALILGSKMAFAGKDIQPRAMLDEITELSEIMRKNGPLGLEEVKIEDDFLKKGVQYIADGYEDDVIRENLERERDQNLTRLAEGQRFYKALTDSAPAFGMIGTLVGLVAMLGNMEDPSKIGPSMAVALLTTLYGAVIANVICQPVADKLDAKFIVEEVNQSMIIDGVIQIRNNASPDLIKEALAAYLPYAMRTGLTDDASDEAAA
ncbi:MAG: MotA/TolQ/ExbB proton channel family protein [Rhizobiales bacterium]|nr:MotA/TolQ/ExbB proton channel family protein [Hyphomicrobiales bacterium]